MSIPWGYIPSRPHPDTLDIVRNDVCHVLISAAAVHSTAMRAIRASGKCSEGCELPRRCVWAQTIRLSTKCVCAHGRFALQWSVGWTGSHTLNVMLVPKNVCIARLGWCCQCVETSPQSRPGELMRDMLSEYMYLKIRGDLNNNQQSTKIFHHCIFVNCKKISLMALATNTFVIISPNSTAYSFVRMRHQRMLVCILVNDRYCAVQNHPLTFRTLVSTIISQSHPGLYGGRFEEGSVYHS